MGGERRADRQDGAACPPRRYDHGGRATRSAAAAQARTSLGNGAIGVALAWKVGFGRPAIPGRPFHSAAERGGGERTRTGRWAGEDPGKRNGESVARRGPPCAKAP